MFWGQIGSLQTLIRTLASLSSVKDLSTFCFFSSAAEKRAELWERWEVLNWTGTKNEGPVVHLWRAAMAPHPGKWLCTDWERDQMLMVHLCLVWFPQLIHPFKDGDPWNKSIHLNNGQKCVRNLWQLLTRKPPVLWRGVLRWSLLLE